MFGKCVYIILVKKNIQLSKGIGQFQARSGPIRFDPVIRPDPVNTRTLNYLSLRYKSNSLKFDFNKVKIRRKNPVLSLQKYSS